MAEMWDPPVELRFNSEAYREVVEALTSFHFGDADMVEESLECAARDFACAQLMMLYALMLHCEEIGEGSIEEQLKALGVAAAVAAEEES